MSGVREALEAERKAEQEFVEQARHAETAPKGWPAALLMFHVGMWRERMRDALSSLRDGRPVDGPPENRDELNDSELASGIGTPLTDAAARADHLLGEIIELYEGVGDQPLSWYVSNTTKEAVLGNSYLHPRGHIYEYLRENGEDELADKLWEDGVADLRNIFAPPLQLGMALYNLACVRARQSSMDKALDLLHESLAMRPDLKDVARTDDDLAVVRGEPRFQELIK